MRKFLLIIMLFASMAYAADFTIETAAKSVIATGYGETEEKSLSRALAMAIEQVVGVHITSEIFTKNRILLEENIISKTSGFIKSYKILSVKTIDDGSIRTVIDAQVDEKPLLDTLRSLNIALLEVDSEELYSSVITNAERIENTKQYMKIQWPLLFQPASKFLKFTIDNIYFDEGRISNGKVPFVVRFYMEPDYKAYDEAVKRLIADIDHFQIASELDHASHYAPEQKRIHIDNAIANISTQHIVNPISARADAIKIAVKHGQRYILRHYQPNNPFQQDLKDFFAQGNQAQHFLIQFKNAAGDVLYEDKLSLFPTEGNISIFFNDKAAWADDSLKSTNFTFGSQPMLSPYIYINIEGELLAMDKLLLGYQSSIDIALIKKFSTISIERAE